MVKRYRLVGLEADNTEFVPAPDYDREAAKVKEWEKDFNTLCRERNQLKEERDLLLEIREQAQIHYCTATREDPGCDMCDILHAYKAWKRGQK